MTLIRWEYLIEIISWHQDASLEQVTAFFNVRGADGWDLVKETPGGETGHNPVQVRYVWKREIA